MGWFDEYVGGPPPSPEERLDPAPRAAEPDNPFAEHVGAAPAAPAAPTAPAPTWGDTARSAGRTVLDAARAAENTLTFGMADRLAGGRDYLVGKITGSGPESYSKAVDKQVAGSAEARERSPYASVAGDVGGAVAIPGMFGAKLGLKLAPKVGGFLGRAIGYGAEGAVVGGLQGAGNTYSGNLPDYVNNATMGGVLGAGTGAVLGGAFGVRRAPGSSAKTPTTAELATDKTARYADLNSRAVPYEASAFARAGDDVESVLQSPQYRFQPERSPVSWKAIDEMRNPPTTAHLGKGAPVYPGDIEAIRQGITSNVSPGPDMKSSRIVKKALDDFMINPPPGAVMPGFEQAAKNAGAVAEKARDAHGAYRRAETLDDLIANARTGAGATYSGLNLENQFRGGVRQLIKLKEGRSQASKRGFTPEEISKLTDFAEGRGASSGANALRATGNMLGGGLGIGATAVGGIASGLGTQYVKENPWLSGAAGVAFPAAGLALRMAANRGANQRIGAIRDMVAQRSPLFLEQAATAPLNPIAQGTARARNAITQELLRQNLE